MFWKRIVISNQERVLVAKNGRFGGIMLPGEYRMFVAPGVSLELERHDIGKLVFESVWADYVANQRPKVVKRHFTLVETNDRQVAMIYVNGRLFKVLTPAKRLLFWRGPAEVTAELIDVIADPGNPPENVRTRNGRGIEPQTTFSVIAEAMADSLLLDGDRPSRAMPGNQMSWTTVENSSVLVVGMRRHQIEDKNKRANRTSLPDAVC